jgi:hypothetical protein
MASEGRKIAVGLREMPGRSDLSFASRRQQVGAYLGAAPALLQRQMYRKWTSPMLANEFSLETLAEATYVKLSQELAEQEAQILSVFSTSAKTRGSSKSAAASTHWTSWLKKPAATTSWNGRDKPSVDVIHKPAVKKKFSWLPDANKRWPQGW